MQIRNASGIYNYTYVYAEDVLTARINPDGSKWFYHPDHLGSTTLITNQSGAIIEDTIYLPFGGVISGGEKEKKLYEGKELDETGAYYFNSRYYDPDLRIFIQADSMLPDVYDPQQLNRYMFERGNPLKYTDPSGHGIEDGSINPLYVSQGMLSIVGTHLLHQWRDGLNPSGFIGIMGTRTYDILLGSQIDVSYWASTEQNSNRKALGIENSEMPKIRTESVYGGISMGLGAGGTIYGGIMKGLSNLDSISTLFTGRGLPEIGHEIIKETPIVVPTQSKANNFLFNSLKSPNKFFKLANKNKKEVN